MKIFIGCSGFSNKEWKNSFYPEKLPQGKWLDHYCTQFNTLEINVTFYRFPQLKTFERWYEKSPEDFIFSIKVPRLVTHYKRMKDCESLISDFYITCKQGLKEKLGPLLFQFPPTFIYTDENLSLILDALDSSLINVVEFRHISWWDKTVYKRLAEKNIIFCGVNHPALPTEVIINCSTVYYRFHGAPKIFFSEYDALTLEKIGEKIMKSKKVQTAFLFFNNTATLAAINNGRSLQQFTSTYKK